MAVSIGTTGSQSFDELDIARANRQLWVLFWTMLVGGTVGANFDVLWHVTRPFDSFFSPPHLVLYSTVAVAAGMLLLLIASPRIRPCFGPGVELPDVPFPVPGPLALTAAGFGVLLLAGMFDATWHTAFGLDETRWSTPHALLGWGMLLVLLGVVASRLALGRHRPPSTAAKLLFGYLLLGLSGPFLGPFGEFATPDMVRAVARIPVLAVQPPAQHAYRIYLEWNLTRTNPVFLLLAPVWIGAALACLHRIDRRAWFLLLVTWGWSAVQFTGDLGAAVALRQYLPLDRNPANWLHVPVLPCAIAFLLLRRLGAGERMAWSLSGAVLALLFAGQVGMPPWALLLVPLAGLTMLVGVRWGISLSRLLEAPTGRRIAAVALTAVLVPLFTGLLDLLLRSTTP